MHTDYTLVLLDEVTVSLGNELRRFSEHTCSAFDTRELRREAAARIRRESKKISHSKMIVSSYSSWHLVF